MPEFICPHCKKIITVGFDCTDYVHDCSQTDATSAVKQDDVVVIGNWEDYSGTGSKSPQDVLRQGIINELQGTRAEVEGMDKEPITRRGARASTHRQRPHLEYIEIKNGRKN